MENQKKFNFRRIMSLILSVCMISSLLTIVNVAQAEEVTVSSNNLVTNSSFRDGLEGWTYNEEFVSLVTEGVDDSSAIHFSAETAPWNTPFKSSEITVEPNTDYEFSFYTRGQSYVRLDIGTPEDGTLFCGKDVSCNKYWEKYTFYFNSGDATSVQIAISLTQNNIESDVDRFYIGKVAEPSDEEIDVSRNLSYYNKAYNGDFELVDDAGYALEWGAGATGVYPGIGLGVDGGTALVFDKYDGYSVQQWNVVVDYNATYRVSFLAKFEDGAVPDGDFSGSQILGNMNINFSKNQLSNSKWTRFTVYLKPINTVTYLKTGTSCKVLMDNLTIQEVTENLVVNGDFENGLEGWADNENVSIVTEDALSGSSARSTLGGSVYQKVTGLSKGRYKLRFSYKGMAQLFLTNQVGKPLVDFHGMNF